MPIVNQFSETIHSHIDTNRYHFVSSKEAHFVSFEENYLSSEHVVAPRGKSMNRKNDFEKALKIFCRHSSEKKLLQITFAN